MGCFGSKPAKQGEKEPAKPAATNTDTPAAKKTADRVAIGDSGVITDKYILGDELGTGGFSVVKEATSKADGEKYAVKIIEKSVIKEDIKLLKREIEIMKKVDHKNILKLHEIFEDDDKVYIVMELVNGSELFDRIVEKGFYSERNAMNVVSQILSAVAYLHSKGIAHRDLKPENCVYFCERTDPAQCCALEQTRTKLSRLLISVCPKSSQTKIFSLPLAVLLVMSPLRFFCASLTTSLSICGVLVLSPTSCSLDTLHSTTRIILKTILLSSKK